MTKNQKPTVLDSIPVPGAPAPAALKPKKASGPLAAARRSFDNLLAQQKEQARLEAGGEPRALIEARGEPVEPEVEEETEPAEAEVTAPATEQPAQVAKESRELERLRAKLLLASVPKRVVESLSDDEAREMWSGMEDRERASAIALQRASESEKRLKETTSKQAEPMRVPTAELDLDEIHSELQETFGEDEANALLKAIQKLVGKEVEPLRADTASFKGMLEEAKKMGTKSVSKTNLDRLAEKLPLLKDNQRAREFLEQQVIQAFEKDPSKYSSAEAAFDDVFTAVYGDVLEASPATSAQDKLAKEKSRIGASALSHPGSRKSDRKPTQMDAAFSAFQALNKNPEDLEGARAAYGRALHPQ